VRKMSYSGRGDEDGREAELDDVPPRHLPIIGQMTGEELRETMRRFPAPVAVVTTEVDEERFGLTVGSLVSLSLSPPLVGISIGKDSSSHEPLRRAEGWTASLLAADQTGVAQHFARGGIPPIALWNGVDVRNGSHGPLVEGALAWLQCRTVSEHDAGDHTILIGEVESTERGKSGLGLVYREGEYHPA
jgi:flavin reductase (DIM6/NTAB) family NADH-FMN oxidoreductase RutF